MRMVEICTKEIPKIGRREYRLEEILQDICDTMGYPISTVKSKDRHREYATCRQIYCYVSRICTKEYLHKIAELVGYEDHTTVIANAKKVAYFLKNNDPIFIILWERYTQYSQVWPIISQRINTV